MAAKFNGEPSIAWSENCSRVEWGSHRSKFKRKECLNIKTWSEMCENGGKLVLKWLFSRLYTGWTLRMIMLGPSTCGQCLVCWEEDGEKEEWRPGPHHHPLLVSTADWATTAGKLLSTSSARRNHREPRGATNAGLEVLLWRRYLVCQKLRLYERMYTCNWLVIASLKRSVVIKLDQLLLQSCVKYYVS